MKNIKKYFTFIFVILIVIILLNQIIYMKYGIFIPKYIKYSSPITQEERKYLEKYGPIKLGTDVTAPPISYYDINRKEYAGLIVDYVKFLSFESGSPINISMYTFYDLLQALKHKEIDVCDMTPSESRAKEFNFSIPIYRLKTLIITPKKDVSFKIEKLPRRKVAIPKGNLAAEYINDILKRQRKEAPNFIYVDDTKNVLELLEKGLVDAGIGDEVLISTYWKEFDVYETRKYNISLLYEKDVVLAVRKDSPVILSVLNKSILQMKKNHIIKKIQQKWFGISESIRGEKKDFEAFINIAIILFLCLIGLYIWNYFLKKNVIEKTKEIEKNKRNINMILNNLNISLFIIDKNYNIIECNKTSLNMLSKKRDEIIQKKIFNFPLLFELFKLFDFSLLEDNLENVFRNTIKNKCYEVKISPFISDDKKLRILSIEDITEKLIMEKKLHQENKMITIGQISAGLAHEIRNPLGTLRNGLYLIKMKVSDEIKEKAIIMMENSIQRINNLIEHLLYFSRSTDKRKQENIEEILKSISTLMKSKLKDKNINLSFEINGTHILFLDIETINIILINLIENAIDAFPVSDENNFIKIFVSNVDNYLQLSIEDNAIGIPESELEFIFDPFYTTKEENYGTGLGLYLVYNEIKKYNGDISIKSKCGEGTKFFISIKF